MTTASQPARTHHGGAAPRSGRPRPRPSHGGNPAAGGARRLALGAEANVASAAWATLRILTRDHKFAPDLAQTIPTLDNGGVKVPGEGGEAMTVTWRLRDTLKWSDGQPLTCDGFRYAWEWVLGPDNVGVVTLGYSDITLAIAPLPRHALGRIPVAEQVMGYRSIHAVR